MTFGGRSRSYIIIEDKGKRARFDGELCVRYFALYAYSMKWLPEGEPEDTKNLMPVTDEERNEFVRAVRKFVRSRECKLSLKFFDDEGKRFCYKNKL